MSFFESRGFKIASGFIIIVIVVAITAVRVALYAEHDGWLLGVSRYVFNPYTEHSWDEIDELQDKDALVLLKRQVAELRMENDRLRDKYRNYDKGIMYLMPQFNHEGVDSETGMRNLFKWAKRAVLNPEEHVIDFSCRYGVDLRSIAAKQEEFCRRLSETDSKASEP